MKEKEGVVVIILVREEWQDRKQARDRLKAVVVTMARRRNRSRIIEIV